MNGTRKRRHPGLVTIGAATFKAAIAERLQRHNVTHVGLDCIVERTVEPGRGERKQQSSGVYALREHDEGADVVAVAWGDVADEAIDRVLDELDRLAEERTRAVERELGELYSALPRADKVGDDDVVVVRPRVGDNPVAGLLCTACSGTGRAAGSDGVDWLPCRECNGTGLFRRLT